MTVYFGGLIGPRRVLLIACPVVAFAALLAPFATHFSILLFLLACIGLGCGCFYPLTLTLIVRKLPPRYILFGVAAYAVDVVGSLHVGSLLEGLFMTHLSWRLIFWTPAILAPAMYLLVYFGVPGTATAAVDRSKLQPNWQGFVYTSAALTCLYLLLTQGERLDWLHSGVIVGLAASAAFLLATALTIHFVRPNPLVDLRFLVRRNILLLTFCLCTLRFSLLSSAQLVPQFLSSVKGYLPLQTGEVLAWVAIPVFVFAFGVAWLMRFFDPRLVLASGFALVAAVCLHNNHLSSDWARQDFLWGELFVGMGAAMAVCGQIVCILLEAINSGAVKSPIRTLTYTAWFHTVRLLGGEIVAAILTHLLTVRARFHASRLSEFISPGRFAFREQMQTLWHALTIQSPSAITAMQRAGGVLSKHVKSQVLTLSIADAYAVEALVLTCCLFLVAAVAREPMQFRDLLKPKS